jgi:hypothetical protein
VAATDLGSALAAAAIGGAAASPDDEVVNETVFDVSGVTAPTLDAPEVPVCTDFALAESAAAIVASSLPTVGVSEIVRLMTIALHLNAVDQRRAVLAALSACMAEKVLAERVLQMSLAGLATDGSGATSLGAITLDAAARRGRHVERVSAELISTASKQHIVVADEE